MPTELHRLIYASRWAPGLERDLPHAVKTIIASSIANNRTSDLTGMLLAHEGWFIQALEGCRGSIAKVMDKIFKDPRHMEPHVLCAGPVTSRAFREWNMTAAAAGPEAQPFLAELGLLTEFDPRTLDGASAFRLMLALAEVERARERTALGLSAA